MQISFGDKRGDNFAMGNAEIERDGSEKRGADARQVRHFETNRFLLCTRTRIEFEN